VLHAAQVREMYAVESTLPPEEQTHTDISKIRTEGQAGDYVARVMARLTQKRARA
jgi:hypothetical protein